MILLKKKLNRNYFKKIMSSSLRGKKIVIFGGNGFIGSHLTNQLCNESCQITIVTRKSFIKNKFFANEPGQVIFKKIDNFDELNIEKLIDDCDIVFNLIGILVEEQKTSFDFVHHQIPKMISSVIAKKKIRSFIHLSALNVDKTKNSKYAISKNKGDNEIRKNFPNAVIVRPSVVFGKGDNFINFFEKLSKFSPFLPLIGTPNINFSNKFLSIIDFKKKVKFQPIYVGDLVQFLINISSKRNKTFELTGPSIKSFDQIFDVILSYKKRKRLYLPVPFFQAKILAMFLQLLPKPLLTIDQINLLQIDSVSKAGLNNLKIFIKNPTSMETAIKNCL